MEQQGEITMKDIKISNLSKIIAISFLVYSCVLVIQGLVVYFLDTEFNILIADQLVFFNRGVGILRGDVQYRDFYTQAAPLSPYLWVIIVLISMLLTGNFSTDYLGSETYLDSTSMMFSSYVFRVFFAFCLILSAALLYKILEQKGTKKSFWISLSYAINPFFLYLASFWGSDECVLPLLIILPIYLLEKEKYYLATLILIIGTGLKYFPILILPLFLVYNKKLVNSLIQLLLFLIGVIASYLPFYFIAPKAFSNQFNYYPVYNARNQGLAALDDHFSNNEYTVVSTYEFLTITLILLGLVSALLILTRADWSFEKTVVLLIPFLLFFPKIQFSYFVMLFPFISVLIFRNNNFSIVYLLLFLSTLLGGTAADYILAYDGSNILSYVASWLITAILYLSMIAVLVHTFLVKQTDQISKVEKSE